MYIVEGSTTQGEIEIAPDVQLVSNSRSELQSNAPISIFPNPAGETLFLSLEKEWSTSMQSIRLIHPAGQVNAMHNIQGIGPHSLDISHLQPGIYWIQIKAVEGPIWQQKFIKF